MDVQPVHDEADRDPVVDERGTREAGLAVVERRHGIEEVGHGADPRIEAGDRFVEGRRAVARGHDDAVRDERADDVERAGQLGGERHHPDAGAGRPVAYQLDVREQQPRRVMGAAPGGSDERALHVPAEGVCACVAVWRPACENLLGALDGGQRRAHEGRKERRHAERHERGADAPERVGRFGQIEPAGAVDLQIEHQAASPWPRSAMPSIRTGSRPGNDGPAIRPNSPAASASIESGRME